MSLYKRITESIRKERVLQHVLFWLGLIFLITIPQNMLENENPYVAILVYKICGLIPQILFSYFIAYYVIPTFLSKNKYAISVFLLIVSTYFFSVLVRILIVYVSEPLVRTPPFEQESLLEIFTQLKFLLLHYVPPIYSTIFIFLAVKYFVNYKAVKEKELQSKTEKVASELKTLKAQLNPHFLFNTLNNIYVLSLDNSPKTPKSIEKLSSILDHVLYRCNGRFVSLNSEIKLLENYIELEKLRYDDRLQVSFNASIESEGEIAPLILLSLVENAFKHGAGEDMGSPKIDINIENSISEFKFMISNTVASKENNYQRTPIGLKNIKKQLNLIYPDRFELLIDSNPNLFTVTVIIKSH